MAPRIRERSGVSRPAREQLDVHHQTMPRYKRFWLRGNTIAHRLPGGLRRSAKSLTAALVYRRAVGDGWASNPYGDAVPIPGRHTSQR